jgi:hypothetical protein
MPTTCKPHEMQLTLKRQPIEWLRCKRCEEHRGRTGQHKSVPDCLPESQDPRADQENEARVGRGVQRAEQSIGICDNDRHGCADDLTEPSLPDGSGGASQ